jgi:ATP-binding protein involved in chromosome partitioning
MLQATHSDDGRERAVRALLEQNSDRFLGVDLWSAAAIDKIFVGEGRIEVEITLSFAAEKFRAVLVDSFTEKLRSLEWAKHIDVRIGWSVAAAGSRRNVAQVKQIRNIVAVASGKGGVGKSTTAANLALGLAFEGAKVGLLDADIYGPSQPRMMGLQGQRPTTRDGKTLQPPENLGLKVMSIGLLIDEEQPMVWRGPMVTQALNQLLFETEWGELDYLVIDMPPGTGDVQLTLAQRVPVSGAVIVTTPQDIALLDARKGLKMFQKVDVPVLGVVENMSTHLCTKCGHEEHVFGAGGGRRMAAQYGVDLLAELPLDIRIREQADGGLPTVAADPDGALAQAYIDLARRTAIRLAATKAAAAPTITVEES